MDRMILVREVLWYITGLESHPTPCVTRDVGILCSCHSTTDDMLSARILCYEAQREGWMHHAGLKSMLKISRSQRFAMEVGKARILGLLEVGATPERCLRTVQYLGTCTPRFCCAFSVPQCPRTCLFILQQREHDSTTPSKQII
jgi:hypothetical protein